MSDAGAPILALNAGSSSLKLALYIAKAGSLALAWKGTVDESQQAMRFQAANADGETVADEVWPGGSDGAFAGPLLRWLDGHLGARSLAAVGHRVVHGGPAFAAPVVLSPTILGELARLTPLAPLHQPRSLAPAKAIAGERPHLVQVACFDTAFHRTIEPPASRYALPRELEANGVRRYGFHGLSYQHAARCLPEILPSRGKVVVAHLGSGGSLCAIRDGQSVDTTMGFSALDGLVMGTRPGRLDPGILLYLMKERGLSHDDLEDMLYHRSGLAGVSGLSSDLRVLLASDDPRAREAVALFVFRAAKEIAGMAGSLRGIDGLVFTGGIGEHLAEIRAMICKALEWLGVVLDPAANHAGAASISHARSAVAVAVLPADEEHEIALGVLQALAGDV